MSQLPYLPDLAQADCFVFLTMISELAGISIVQGPSRRPGMGCLESSPKMLSPPHNRGGRSGANIVSEWELKMMKGNFK
jgi:hypothetical protein